MVATSPIHALRSTGEDCDMARRRLQQQGDLTIIGGWWRLRWREDRITDGKVTRKWSPRVTIGPAPGNPMRIKALTKKEAQRLAWESVLCRIDQNVTVPDSVKTVEEFVRERYIPGHVAMQADGATIEGRIRTWILPGLGDIRLRDVRKQHVQQLVASVIGAGRSVQTATHVRNTVSSIFRFAEGEDCFRGVNPAKHVELPDMVRKDRQALNYEQATALLDAAPERYRPIIRIALLSTLTIGEILGLKWNHLNLSDQWKNVDGESVAPYCFNVRWVVRQSDQSWHKRLKTPARKRNIPLIPEMVDDLVAIRSSSEFTGPDDPVFAGSTGRPLDGHNILNRTIKPLGESLGMPWINWHCLRHTTATWMDEQGVSVADRMAMGGWSQARTMLHYSHSDLERRREHMAAMAGRLKGGKVVEMPAKKRSA